MGLACIIAESDPFISRLLLRFAEQSGLKTVSTQIGQEVLEFARQNRPDVIILDPELPGKLRGWEIIHSLRNDPQTCAIPLITCSWQGEAEVIERVGAVESNLKKPDLHYEDFLRVLHQAGIDPGKV
jgi:two-component system cell cycle response regulator DivK